MQRLRRFFFYLFAATYAVSCPLILLYALGYAFKPTPQLQWVETGLIHLETVPSGAAVYLEGKRCEEMTPTALKELLPGEYRIRLELEGYQPWERSIWVEAKQAHRLDEILLVPDRLEPEELSSHRWERLIPVPETPYLLLTKGPLLKEAVVYDRQRRSLHPLVGRVSPWGDAAILSHWVVPESAWVLLQVRTTEGLRWIGFALDEEAPEPKDLTPLFVHPPEEITWSPRRPDRLFLLREGSLDRLDLQEMSLYPQLAQRIRGCGVIDPGELLLLTNQGRIHRIRHTGELLETFFEDSPLGRELLGGEGRFSVHPLSGDLWLFLGKQGRLLTNRPPYQLVEEGVRGFQYDKRRQRLLVWTDRRLGMVDFSRRKAEEEPLEEEAGVRWVYEGGARIRQAFWVYQGSHILFQDRDLFLLLEVETYGNPALNWSVPQALHRLAEAAGASEGSYSDEEGTLLYLDRSQGRLVSIPVVPPPVAPAEEEKR